MRSSIPPQPPLRKGGRKHRRVLEQLALPFLSPPFEGGGLGGGSYRSCTNVCGRDFLAFGHLHLPARSTLLAAVSIFTAIVAPIGGGPTRLGPIGHPTSGNAFSRESFDLTRSRGAPTGGKASLSGNPSRAGQLPTWFFPTRRHFLLHLLASRLGPFRHNPYE